MKISAIILALLFTAIGCQADTLDVDGFEVSWDAGWTLVSKADPVRYSGPGPSGLTIDLMDHGEIGPTQILELKRKWTRYAIEALPKLATRHGVIVIPLKTKELPSGYTLISIACAGKKRGRDYFGLMFVSLSPEGRLAQFVVEGFGDAKSRFPIYHDYMASGKWKNEPNKPLQGTEGKAPSSSTEPVALRP